MRTIIEILIDRDGCTKEEAVEIKNEMRELIMDCAVDCDIEGAYDILADYGFEPDYLEELLF